MNPPPKKKKVWKDSAFENKKGLATPFSKQVLARRLGRSTSKK